MKTIFTHLNINNHRINQSTTPKKSHRYYRNYHQAAAGDINRNAAISQAEYERDACEEELYRLRFDIENLLANHERGDRRRFANSQKPSRTMTTKTNDINNRKTENWLDEWCPCCRRWGTNISNDYVNNPNEYTYRRDYNDRNYDTPLRRTSESPFQSQSFISTSPSPSISPRYMEPIMRHTKNDLRRSIDSLINQNRPINTDVSDLLRSKDIKDSAYQSLILKILEAKALDCLCSGYSKQNTQQQIAEALSQINQRNIQHHSDSVSDTSSQSSLTSYEPSSTASSVSTYDESLSSHSDSSHSSNQQISSPSSSGIQTPDTSQKTSPFISPNDTPHKIKSSLKSNENNKSPKKNSKVTIVSDETPRSKESKKKSSKPKQKKVSSRSKSQTKKPSKTTKKPSKSRTSDKKRKPSRTTKKPSKSKSSSKSKKRSSSKSPSRSKTRKKTPSKKRGSSKKKRSKSSK